MVYLDQAATSFPKLEEVKQAVMSAFDVAGNANRSSNMDSSRLIFEAGTSKVSCLTMFALRMRVRKSAIGSVMTIELFTSFMRVYLFTS